MKPRRFKDNLARCPNQYCVNGRVVAQLPTPGTVTTTCSSCLGFGLGRGGPARLENPPKRAKRAKRSKRSKRTNPPRTVVVRQFGGKKGHLVGRDVFALEYANVGSSQRLPYRHDFDGRGIELWAMADGSLTLRHPNHRLWDDFVVSDSE